MRVADLLEPNHLCKLAQDQNARPFFIVPATDEVSTRLFNEFPPEIFEHVPANMRVMKVGVNKPIATIYFGDPENNYNTYAGDYPALLKLISAAKAHGVENDYDFWYGAYTK